MLPIILVNMFQLCNTHAYIVPFKCWINGSFIVRTCIKANLVLVAGTYTEIGCPCLSVVSLSRSHVPSRYSKKKHYLDIWFALKSWKIPWYFPIFVVSKLFFPLPLPVVIKPSSVNPCRPENIHASCVYNMHAYINGQRPHFKHVHFILAIFRRWSIALYRSVEIWSLRTEEHFTHWLLWQ